MKQTNTVFGKKIKFTPSFSQDRVNQYLLQFFYLPVLSQFIKNQERLI